jgi:ribonuclease HI
MNLIELSAYTDASFHVKEKLGSWVFIIVGDEENVKSGIEKNTTQNRMELKAVIECIKYVEKNYPKTNALTVYTDSQYVCLLPERKSKLHAMDFETRKGNKVKNTELIKDFYSLNPDFKLRFVKVKAHQKKVHGEINYNRLCDKHARKLVRNYVKNLK